MVNRFRGGVAKETFLLKIRDLSDVEVAEFHEGDRTGNSNGATWTDLTLNNYIWEWEAGRPSTLIIEVDDPARELFDEIKRGYKARLALDNIMKDVLLSYDMETVAADGDILDLSLNSNDGAITGTTDIAGWWGRARNLPGAGNRINPANTIDPTTLNMTIAATLDWTTNPTPNYGGIHGGGNSWECRVNNNGTLAAIFYQATGPDIFTSVASPLTYNDGEHHRVIYILRAGLAELYVDGELVGQDVTSPITSLRPSTGVAIGPISSDYNGNWDETIVVDDAWTSKQVKEDFKRRGRAPRFYFDGRVRKKKHQDGMTTFTCADNLVDAVDQEIYDLIYEGMETDDSDPPSNIPNPSFAYRQFIPFHPSDGHHNQIHTHFQDVDLANLADTDKVHAPLLEQPGQSETKRQAGEEIGVWQTSSSDMSTWCASFTATASQLLKVAVFLNPQGVTDGVTIAIRQAQNDDAGALINIVNLTGSSQVAFSTAGEAVFTWFVIDLSALTARMEVGAIYYLCVEEEIAAGGWTSTTPLLWGAGEGNRGMLRQTGFSPFTAEENKKVGVDLVLLMDENWETIEMSEVAIKKGTGSSLLIGDLSAVGSLVSPTAGVSDFMRGTYFYSKGNKKVSDVIERILERVGMTAIFTNPGGLSSTSTTEDLGLYVPQGGTALEHLTQLAALTNDRLKFVAPGFLQFQRWPEPTHIRNSSFELTDSAGNLLDWTLVQQVGVGSSNQEAASPVKGPSGDFVHRIDIDGNSQTSAEMRVYQDVEDFDPVLSGIDGNNLRFTLHRNQSWTGFTFQVTIYDYGSFDNGITTAIATPVLGTWEDRRIKVERTHFRISFEFLYSGAALGVTVRARIDDVFPHYENLRSFFVVDAGKKDTDYSSNVLPGIWDIDSTIGVHMLDDYRTGPIITRETSRRMVNEAVVFGRRSHFGFSEPVIAISRNPARAGLFGDRSRFVRQESITTIDDAYNRAKKQVRFDATFRTSLDMVGQYPFLNGRVMRLFFPQDGLAEPTPMEVTGITVDSKRTLVRFNRSVTEQFVDVEKLQERESELSSAFDLDLSDSLFYFTTVDLPTTVDPNVVVKARLVSEGAVRRSDYIDLDQRDTRDGTEPSVWSWSVSKKSGPTSNTTDTNVWTQFEIADSSGVDGNPTLGVLATVNFDQVFAKLENHFLSVWLFAQ